MIASAHHHAASGYCMPIDGRDDWARKLQQLAQADLEGGKKPAEMILATLQHPIQIHAGRKAGSCSSQNHRPAAFVVQLSEFFPKFLEQFKIEGPDFAMIYPQNHDSVLTLCMNHRCLRFLR